MSRNDWLAKRIKALGKTGQGLANALGVNKARISEIIGGRRGVKAHEVTVMATYLEMSERDVIALLTGATVTALPGAAGPHEPHATGPSPSHAEVGPSGKGARGGPQLSGGLPTPDGAADPRTAVHPIDAIPYDLPVYGSTGNGSGDFFLTGEVVDQVRRPPALAGARTVFALYVMGTAMVPRYDEGDIIIITPAKPPVPGCDVIVELQSDDVQAQRRLLLRTFRGQTESSVLLSQLNPAEQQDVPRDRIKKVSRVLRFNELLGL